MPHEQITMSFDACICGNAACPVPYGKCHCGCGVSTDIAQYTNTRKRSVAGNPKLFIPYHHLRSVREIVPTDTSSDIRMIALGNGLFATIDAEDYDKVNGYLYHAHFDDSNIYAIRDAVDDDGKRIKVRMHWDILQKPPLGEVIDHRDGYGLNNRKRNLRQCPLLNNAWNQGIKSNNTSGHTGVHWIPASRKWRVEIMADGKRKHLGCFPEHLKDEAVRVRIEAEKQYFGEFARAR